MKSNSSLFRNIFLFSKVESLVETQRPLVARRHHRVEAERGTISGASLLNSHLRCLARHFTRKDINLSSTLSSTTNPKR